ncbi:hypothetical protein [Sphingomonas mollis]|uniref:Uncharacterized protein n=1 Tax=Sphingomonas mollis TaxID=2795726 RepID=A0ABS0XSE4_9SPHN|nr:hypothetical protein [Sphingomonas sp. BT553]MBJ6122929.1 hypothetical protein [Sphingomonas sp. BT553]
MFLLYALGSVSSGWFGTLAGRVGRRKIFWMPTVILMAGVALTAATPIACCEPDGDDRLQAVPSAMSVEAMRRSNK